MSNLSWTSWEQYAKHLEKENQELKNEIHILNERLENYIPRRRVRRAYKVLRNILEADMKDERIEHIENLRKFVQQIEESGSISAGQDIKQSVEHLIGTIDLDD